MPAMTIDAVYAHAAVYLLQDHVLDRPLFVGVSTKPLLLRNAKSLAPKSVPELRAYIHKYPWSCSVMVLEEFADSKGGDVLSKADEYIEIFNDFPLVELMNQKWYRNQNRPYGFLVERERLSSDLERLLHNESSRNCMKMYREQYQKIINDSL